MLKENEIIKEEQEWQEQKGLIERKQKIEQEKKQLKGKKITTTKWLILFLFINCTLIELFTGWSTIQSLRLSALNGQSVDFSPLVTLIGAVVSEVIGFAIYAVKSMKENCEGGVTYSKAMADLALSNLEDGKGSEDEQ